MLQRSCREIDERRDFFVATKCFRHAEIFSSRRDFFGVFSSPGNIWRAPYSPHLSPHSRFFQMSRSSQCHSDMI